MRLRTGRKDVLTMLAAVLVLAFAAQPLHVSAQAEANSISNPELPVSGPSASSIVKKMWTSMRPLKLKSHQPDGAARDQVGKNAGRKERSVALKPGSSSSAVLTRDGLQEAILKDDTRTETTSAPPVSRFGQEPAAQSDPVQSQAGAMASPQAVTTPEGSSGKSGGALSSPATAGTPPSTDKSTESLWLQAEEGALPRAAEKAPTPAPAAGGSTVPSFEPGGAAEAKPESQITVADLSPSPSPAPQAFTVRIPGQGPIVVDSDEEEEVEETLRYEELETDEGKTKVKAGARFPIINQTQITSKTAKEGDPILGRLKYDLKIGDRLVAEKGAVVNGHVNYVLRARTILHSLVSKERWYRNSGAIGITFDEIVTRKGEHIPLNAVPSRQARIVKNKAEGRELGVNHYGQVTGPWAQQLRYKAVRIGLNAALAPAGVFSFGAMPVALGVMGAVNPNFAFSRPVGLNVRHRRLKGFAWGFLSGIPGSWLIEDTTVKGQEAVLKPGDEFYAEFAQEFTGEPATDAQLMPGASTKVRGQVLTDPKKGKKPAGAAQKKPAAKSK